MDGTRLFIKVTRKTLPRVKDKYPFVYLERGRLEIDDSSVKWIDSDGNVIRLPIATINCLLLGPGTSVTHEAVKVMAASNCAVCWVGEDSLLFYASGATPTADTVNMRRQIRLSADKDKSLRVAVRMMQERFPSENLTGKTLSKLKGLEGLRVKETYEKMASKYGVGWKGRSYVPGKFEMSDVTNRILTSANAALYGIVTSAVISLGYSPHVGFIHSGSPLPFIYDIADLYKEKLCVDLAFNLTLQCAGVYNKYAVSESFRKRALEMNLTERIPEDINRVLDVK